MDWLDLDPPPIGLDVVPLFPQTCRCDPCPGRGTDGHGHQHCAECCFGTGVIAEPECPTHGELAYSNQPKWADLFGIDPDWPVGDAELALHVPWCGVHYTPATVCTAGCQT